MTLHLITYPVKTLESGIITYSLKITVFLIFLTAFVGLATLVYFTLASHQTKRLGLTSELSFIITFVLGFLALTDIIHLHTASLVGLLFV